MRHHGQRRRPARASRDRDKHGVALGNAQKRIEYLQGENIRLVKQNNERRDVVCSPHPGRSYTLKPKSVAVDALFVGDIPATFEYRNPHQVTLTFWRERLRLLAECHGDPDLFNTAILGRPPFWSGQRRMLQSVNDYRITVCYTGHSVGKDFALGCVIPWWLFTRSNSLVVVTGPSQTLLGSVTWKELRMAVENSEFPLGMKVSQGVHGSPLRAVVRGDWGALGYSTTCVERASGQHNPGCW